MHREGNGILKTWCAKLKPGNNGYRYQVYAGWELGVDDFSKREELFVWSIRMPII